jgi:AhpD family alkylhydroperoxidase
MQQRFDYRSVAPEVYNGMLKVQAVVNASGLEKSLLELVKLRASQINGCAFCIDMHFKDAVAEGESAQRLYLLDAWREAPLYTPRERAALAWTEALTRVHVAGAPDDVYDELARHYSQEEIAHLTLAIVAINGWNRLSIAANTSPTYQRPAK